MPPSAPTQTIPTPPSFTPAMSTPSAAPTTTPLSSTVMPLLSVGVATMSMSTDLPHSSSALLGLAMIVLPSMTLASSSCPSISLDHVYTSCDTNSMWKIGYRPEQRTPSDYVSLFYQNLIRSIGVQNSTDATKVFLQRSVKILEENIQGHQEALNKAAFLEAEVTKWRANAWTVKDSELLDEEDIDVGEEDVGEEDDGANVQVVFSLLFLYFDGFITILAL